jgi:hypothetical protein
MEDTASHETVYKLAHGADKAAFSAKSDPTILTFVQFAKLHRHSICDIMGGTENGDTPPGHLD